MEDFRRMEVNNCAPSRYKAAGFSSICEYVRNNSDACDGDGYIPWTQFKVCTNSDTFEILVLILAAVFFLYLFMMFATTVDGFFSPNIVTIVDYYQIPQDIAGVTLVAFGNGAPDVFSAIASVMNVKHPEAGMALSVLMGGDFFVLSVVLGSVILISPCQVMRRPVIRDILFYLLTLVCIVSVLISSTELQMWQPIMFLVIYLIYACCVVGGSWARKQLQDGSHECRWLYKVISALSGLLPKKIPDGNKIRPEKSPNAAANVNYALEEKMNARKTDSNYAQSSQNFNLKPDKMGNINNLSSYRLTIPIQSSNYDRCIEEEEEDRVITKDFLNSATVSSNIETDDTKVTGILFDVIRRLCPLNICQFCKADCFTKFRLILKIPCMFILNLTVPLATGSWNKPLAIIHSLSMPLAFCFAFKVLFNNIGNVLPLWTYALGLSTLSSIFILLFTSKNMAPKYYKPVAAWFGFIMSVSWIYVTSGEVINTVIMFGNVFGICYQVLFLTAVAWANSASDLVADCVIAKHGFAKMAFSATFGSALFSSLIGFGATFLVAKLQGKTVEVSIDRVKVVMLIALATVIISSLVLLFVQKFRLRRFHGIYLIVFYVIFLAIVLLVNQHII
ncbi:sodium/calcium exchanger protein domain-containing protein [Ditylenchus destructor]|uniref:Sodium/calcium exchanger protein domain-containing protein n=1 Tax=Ditylenchus destructor TaxID=166010 RepID=A0AAD4R653_9BILA|nr:sodium/calcium exchanger protein domain-containing protein [Ditylenchus destructor]